MKNKSKKILFALFSLTYILIGCDNYVDKETQKLINEKIEFYEKQKSKSDLVNQTLQNSILIEAEIPDEIKISEELGTSNLDGNREIMDLMDDKFIKSQSRYDLLKIAGHTTKLVSSDSKTKVYEVDIFSYLNDTIKPKVINPGVNGLLSEFKITNKMTATLNFFIGEGSLNNSEIYHGTVSETANIIIDEKELDLNKIKRVFITPESRKNIELITRVTVTEFLHKKYKKREKKIKVKEFPLIGSGVSLGTEFFTETSSLNKSFKVSIDTTPIEEIIIRLENN